VKRRKPEDPNKGTKSPKNNRQKKGKLEKTKNQRKENKKLERKPISTPSGTNRSSAKDGVGTNGFDREGEGRRRRIQAGDEA
jgi:hypothetical protein